MKTRVVTGGLLLVLCWGACGCGAPAESEREAWLRTTLIEDNLHLIERDPEMARGKFLKMASQPYLYFRGSLGQFLRDGCEQGPGYLPTRYVTPQSARVWLLGDPHVENLGSFRRADGALVVDFNDFDSARHGPWLFDLRRLALSFYVSAQPLLGDEEALALAREVAQGYAEALGSLEGGAPGLRVSRGAGVITDDLLRRAERDGAAREELDLYTVMEGDQRHLLPGQAEAPTLEGVIADELREATPEEEALVREALRRAAPTLADPALAEGAALRLKGVGRRLGAGVSSYSVLRYYALAEGPTDDPADDLLLELKETTDPPGCLGLQVYPARPWSDNGERVVRSQRALQASDDHDRWLGWGAVGAVSLRVREHTRYQRGVSVDRIHEKLAEGDWGVNDLRALARLSGGLLARAHAQAPLLDQRPALPALLQAVGGDNDGLAREISNFARTYGQQTLEDQRLLQGMIERHGPLLGYDRQRGGGRP